jgi:DNA-binding transcriptional LysR family regulator
LNEVARLPLWVKPRPRPAGAACPFCPQNETSSGYPLRSAKCPRPDVKAIAKGDYGLTDIVAERYDAGVCLGEQVAKDMIALRIGPDFHQALVGAPSYFARRPRPNTPHELIDHACINLRLPTSGGLWSWPFVRKGRELKVRTEGPLAFNSIPLIVHSALAGLGSAYLPEDVVRDHVIAGRLVRVLADWSPLMTGYHLYYPNRQASPAFSRLVEALRYRS